MTDSELRKLLAYSERFLVRSYGGKGLDFEEVLSDWGLRLAKEKLPPLTAREYWDRFGYRSLQWTIRDYLKRIRAVKALQTVNVAEGYRERADRWSYEVEADFLEKAERLEKLLGRIARFTPRKRAALDRVRAGLPINQSESGLLRAVVRQVKRLAAEQDAGLLSL